LNGRHVVFGRVLKGYKEVIQRLADVPVDEKDRPTVPIIISNCGQLELRKPDPETDGTEHVDKKPRTPQKRSKSVDSQDSDQKKQKSKKKHKKRRDHRDPSVSPPPPEKVKETEEEYDARLEREEKERLDELKRKHLERLRRQYEVEAQSSDNSSGGIRFKGRGRMKFIDPETNAR